MELEIGHSRIQWGEDGCCPCDGVTDQRRMEEQLRLSLRIDAIGQLTAVWRTTSKSPDRILGKPSSCWSGSRGDEDLRPVGGNAQERC
jgi:hypothetical protein